MTPLKIACVGEAMIELMANKIPGEAQLNVAGDTLNTAIYMRRLLPKEHEVAFVSALGCDPLSQEMLRFIEDEGVSTSAIYQNPERLAGIYSISTDKDGERSFQYWRENSAARLLFQTQDGISFDLLKSFDVIYTSAITLAILPAEIRQAFLSWIQDFRKTGGVFAFDSNYRPRLWENRTLAQKTVEQAWKLCDIALPSLDDELALFGEKDESAVLKRFQSYPSCKGALKRGPQGPIALNEEMRHKETNQASLYPPALKVVDTTAAGDSFSGAFLANYLINRSLTEALSAGHECASRVVGYKGAIIPKSNASFSSHKTNV